MRPKVLPELKTHVPGKCGSISTNNMELMLINSLVNSAISMLEEAIRRSGEIGALDAFRVADEAAIIATRMFNATVEFYKEVHKPPQEMDSYDAVPLILASMWLSASSVEALGHEFSGRNDIEVA